MDSSDLAAEMQAAKDDPEEWGDPTSNDQSEAETRAKPKERAAKRRLAAMVSVRLSPEELEKVQARALQRGLSVSAYLRGLAVRDMTLTEAGGLAYSVVSLSSGETSTTRFASPQLLTDGGRLETRAS
jgi:predicted DNA binding CopG/RHH family protein